jgi:glycine C-acetyltransferase
MSHDRLDDALGAELEELNEAGTAKGTEKVIETVVEPRAGLGRRHLLAGVGGEFLRMNSNSYLGLSHHPAVIDSDERASRQFGAGPGAVRFVSGTFQPHIDLEARLAAFHGREACAVFSSAYAAVISTLVPLVTGETVVFSDELNHNCIINALRLARPMIREVYPHLDYDALDAGLGAADGSAQRAIVVTDGVFSMRGDHADLSIIAEIADRHDGAFSQNVVVVVDDSHGVGAFGETGRGTEEVSGARCDVLIGTLGKAFGVNGGYVASSGVVIDYLREKGLMYVYSNPITPGEAAAADTAVSIVDSSEGQELLAHLARMTERFENGLVDAGLETIPGPHPVVPLMVRDTGGTADLVDHLYRNEILATGLNYPVVPKGDEEIRFQISADHTPADIDYVLEVLAGF